MYYIREGKWIYNQGRLKLFYDSKELNHFKVEFKDKIKDFIEEEKEQTIYCGDETLLFMKFII